MWLLACSGPGAPATIGRNIAFTQQQAMVVAALTATSLILWVPFNRRIRYPAVRLLLLSFHPAWTMIAVRGDCGHGVAGAALWGTLFAVGAVILQVRSAVRLRQSRSRRPRQASA